MDTVGDQTTQLLILNLPLAYAAGNRGQDTLVQHFLHISGGWTQIDGGVDVPVVEEDNDHKGLWKKNFVFVKTLPLFSTE